MGSYSVTRSTTVDAPAHEVHALIDDFHAWTQWSPWEDLDPELQRTYSGSEHGVGAVYQVGEPQGRPGPDGGHPLLAGERRGGAGLPQAVQVLEHDHLQPRRLRQRHRVEWRMTGEQKGLMSALGKVYSMDRLIGPDFEKGLARLKAVAERSR